MWSFFIKVPYILLRNADSFFLPLLITLLGLWLGTKRSG